MISIVIPLCNESPWLEETANNLLSDLRSCPEPCEILLVENGSADDTLVRAQTMAARLRGVIRPLSIPGPDYGGAVRKGLLTAVGDRCVVVDADNWQAAFFQQALSRLARGADIVVGSKCFAEDRRPVLRRLATRANRWLVGAVFPTLRDLDVHGTLVCRGQGLKPLAARCVGARDVFKIDLLAQARRAGWKVESIPISTRETRTAPPRPGPCPSTPGTG